MFGILKLIENRLYEGVDDLIIGRDNEKRVNEVVTYRPRCCGCTSLAAGRICYTGKFNTIVDNPFCRDCFPEIYKQTYKLLKEVFGDKIEADFALIQKWHLYQTIPPMPETIASLITKGMRLHADPPDFNSIS